jgi:hypothetical protein
MPLEAPIGSLVALGKAKGLGASAIKTTPAGLNPSTFATTAVKPLVVILPTGATEESIPSTPARNQATRLIRPWRRS